MAYRPRSLLATPRGSLFTRLVMTSSSRLGRDCRSCISVFMARFPGHVSAGRSRVRNRSISMWVPEGGAGIHKAGFRSGSGPRGARSSSEGIAMAKARVRPGANSAGVPLVLCSVLARSDEGLGTSLMCCCECITPRARLAQRSANVARDRTGTDIHVARLGAGPDAPELRPWTALLAADDDAKTPHAPKIPRASDMLVPIRPGPFAPPSRAIGVASLACTAPNWNSSPLAVLPSATPAGCPTASPVHREYESPRCDRATRPIADSVSTTTFVALRSEAYDPSTVGYSIASTPQ